MNVQKLAAEKEQSLKEKAEKIKWKKRSYEKAEMLYKQGDKEVFHKKNSYFQSLSERLAHKEEAKSFFQKEAERGAAQAVWKASVGAHTFYESLLEIYDDVAEEIGEEQEAKAVIQQMLYYLSAQIRMNKRLEEKENEAYEK